MGIKGLGKIINMYAPNAIEYIKYNNYETDTYFIFDTYLLLHQILLSGRNNIDTEMGISTTHVVGFYYRILKLIRNRTNMIWVFDGAPPLIKLDTLNKRKEIKQKANTLLTNNYDMLTETEIIKLQKRNIKLTKNMVQDIQLLLQLFGIPYIEAISEAEIQCVAFSNTHKIVSKDWDVLAFGGAIMVTNIDFVRGEYQQISLNIVLKELDLTHEQFIELCILLGCDYCPKIKGLYNIYDEYIKFKNINLLLTYLNEQNHINEYIKYHIPLNYINTFNEAKNFYLNAKVIDPLCPNLDLSWKKPDVIGIIDFMCNRYGLIHDKVEKSLNIIMDKYY